MKPRNPEVDAYIEALEPERREYRGELHPLHLSGEAALKKGSDHVERDRGESIGLVRNGRRILSACRS
jgi:hypothetical protein